MRVKNALFFLYLQILKKANSAFGFYQAHTFCKGWEWCKDTNNPNKLWGSLFSKAIKFYKKPCGIEFWAK